jgi:hypothetical protein
MSVEKLADILAWELVDEIQSAAKDSIAGTVESYEIHTTEREKLLLDIGMQAGIATVLNILYGKRMLTGPGDGIPPSDEWTNGKDNT